MLNIVKHLYRMGAGIIPLLRFVDDTIVSAQCIHNAFKYRYTGLGLIYTNQEAEPKVIYAKQAPPLGQTLTEVLCLR